MCPVHLCFSGHLPDRPTYTLAMNMYVRLSVGSHIYAIMYLSKCVLLCMYTNIYIHMYTFVCVCVCGNRSYAYVRLSTRPPLSLCLSATTEATYRQTGREGICCVVCFLHICMHVMLAVCPSDAPHPTINSPIFYAARLPVGCAVQCSAGVSCGVVPIDGACDHSCVRTHSCLWRAFPLFVRRACVLLVCLSVCLSVCLPVSLSVCLPV